MLLSILSFSLMTVSVAQDAGAESFGLNSDQPVDLSAQRCEVFENQDVVECTGEVRVTQGETILTADRMKVFGMSSGEGFQTIEGEGNVRYAGGGNAISGNHALYDGPNTTITVTGDVVVIQGEQIMVGGKLVYNTTTRAIDFMPGEDGRVRGLFYTKQTESADGAVTN